MILTNSLSVVKDPHHYARTVCMVQDSATGEQKEVTAEIVISCAILRQQIAKAYNNANRKSQDGAVVVRILP